MKLLKSCIAAFRFLTILPMPTSYGTDVEDLDNSPFFFPLVGLVLGLTAAAVAWFLWQMLPNGVSAVVLIILLFSFSGALHLDGLADTADGFFSSRPREKILEIMRDSRIGVMGVVALWAVLLLKFSCLSSLQNADAVKAGFLMPLAGRCAMVVMMALLPYVRPQGGLGTRFYSGRRRWKALVGILVLFACGFISCGTAGLLLACLVLLILLLFCYFCFRRIGGATGDTLGAACEIAETSATFFIAAGLLS
jgi:adenosylcobinamide-GDP ribazoletransferase